MLNREVFLEDPTNRVIPNKCVAKIGRPETEKQWNVLRFELSQFVCEGEYERGLERILSSYLGSLDRDEQPAVWVSGFYGSGKSHFLRVLEHLWTDTELPGGGRAQGLVELPAEIRAALTELSTVGKRSGGLWSAAGKLGSGASGSVRLAFLEVLLAAADLPKSYGTARFVIWLKQEGLFDQLVTEVESASKSFDAELSNFYVAQELPNALIKLIPNFAADAKRGRELLKAQFPDRGDISDTELMEVMKDILALRSTVEGRIPCTLIVLDELQQFIGEDSERTLHVQQIAENISSHFGSLILLVAAGQSAMGSTPTLQKLQARFTVRVELSEIDVDTVIRRMILQKAQDKTADLKEILTEISGEIDRELQGTKIAPCADDEQYLMADYPLLPARRRFWEHALSAGDQSAVASQLRNQLSVVLGAVKEVSDKPLGTVVPADFLYDSLAPDMLRSRALLRELYETIEGLKRDSDGGLLKSRLCALIFFISQLKEAGRDIGVKATPEFLADLLVEDLIKGSGGLRKEVQERLGELAETGIIIEVDGEYELQTRESQEWEADYRSRFNRIKDDTPRIASDRESELRSIVEEKLKSLSIVQGNSRTPRKISLSFNQDPPKSDGLSIPIWIRDEWSMTPTKATEEAAALGVDSPIVHVLLPRLNAESLKNALASCNAAKETLALRAEPTTDEGLKAKKAIEARSDTTRLKLDELLEDIAREARVFLGGGSAVSEGSLIESIKAATEAAQSRLFPNLSIADHLGWGTVVVRADQGATDALKAVGYEGDPEKQPVCKEVLDFVSASGSKGTDIRERFKLSPNGWPQDAIDGSLMVLTKTSSLRAELNGQPVKVTQNQIGKILFYKETIVISVSQRIELRKLFQAADIQQKAGEEDAGLSAFLQAMRDLAKQAGGDSPLPKCPSTTYIEELVAQAGNERLAKAYEQRERLFTDLETWQKAAQLAGKQQEQWQKLDWFVKHARNLEIGRQTKEQIAAIFENRSLLEVPDPVSPLIGKIADALREELVTMHDRYTDVHDQGIKELQASEEWTKLSDERWKEIVERCGLGPLVPLKIGTDGELLAVLDERPLSIWPDLIAGLGERVKKARSIAAKEVEPKAVRITPASASLKSKEDVDVYVQELRKELLRHVNSGNPVII